VTRAGKLQHSRQAFTGAEIEKTVPGKGGASLRPDGRSRDGVDGLRVLPPA
jgi:hypothetical protein